MDDVNSSGSEFIPDEDENESSDSEFSDISDIEIETRSEDGWSYISDPYIDTREQPLHKFENEYDIHPAVTVEELSSPGMCFEAIFSHVIKYLCEWTNKRADIEYSKLDNPIFKVYGLKWYPVNIEEMYTFFALTFLMGITHCPEISDFWSGSMLCSGPKCFTPLVMSRCRYQSILKFLRFSDPSLAKRNSPLSRLGQYMALLKEVCQLLVDPGETIAIDECLMMYKGRLHFRQYIKDKRSRFGLKLFCLCPSAEELRGYTWNFALYIGKDLYEIPNYPDSKCLPVSERIVVYLAERLLEQGRHIVVDNWYLSTRLAEYLFSKKTYITGTIRKNRGVPEFLCKEKLEKGQSCFLRKGDQVLVRYFDKRDVYALSTRYTAGMCEKTRYLASNTVRHLNKPLHIEKYNYLMGSVDATDQDLAPYNPARKSYTWFKKFGIHLAARVVLNAKVLYQVTHGKKIRMKEFMLQTCGDLLRKYNAGFRMLEQEKTSIPPTPKNISSFHKLVQIPSTGLKKRKQKPCRVCTKHGRRKDTRMMCAGCEDEPGICSQAHLEEYHRQ